MTKSKVKNDGITLKIAKDDGRSDDYLNTNVVMRPHVRNGNIVGVFSGKHFSGEKPNITDIVDIMLESCKKVRDGDLSDQRDILTSQAMALDALFTSMVSRAGANMGEYMDAADRYMRLALKAQLQCKATIEALEKMSREGTQTIKHVHVDNRGGQAVITDTVETGGQNEKTGKQSHAKCNDGSKVLGRDPQGIGVPIASREGQEALQDARRDQSGRSDGQ